VRAMSLRAQAPVEARPLALIEREPLRPGAHEILVRVEACAVCRTDLHVIEGDLAFRRPGLVPGHQVVGRVSELGAAVTRFRVGDRVGIAWLRKTCGSCRTCARGDENLCLSPEFTGWDADGGYAEEALVPADFAHAVPEGPSAREIAPLLCAGIIGYRAYRRSRIRPGGRLGLWGFGGSAHIAIQVARHFGCEVYVFSRGGEHRGLAQELGAAWVGDSREPSPRPLDGAILFAPAGDLVPPALEALDRGATLAIAGIHLSDIPALDYQRHLFQERAVQSVTANTREDARELLELAAAIPIRTHTQTYPLEAANEALLDLKGDRVRGSAVLVVGAT
jgi:propanol-preferring alcohol dehydrogenase